ncbi:electron transfer flavo protein, alpha subunit [Linderina pennispora]|uniref:Probable electron transfer flavoprotein subunit alpha n=1 Tax=Linderina pennispora TaxID=61395 RepID=A0A1Y1WNN8_9FUNG|nr:electron transfer flavo protein, alpha subunit [Linderina pennispora]ORX74744.1 electron transfer flavo protein, alpha subunit [Linderina pennispora]
MYASQRAGLASLVFVEAKGSGIDEGALNAITAARKLSGPVTAVVAGSTADAAAKAVGKIEGVDKVIVAKDAPESTATLLQAIQKQESSTHVFAAHTAAGKSIMPRLAALLDTQQISDITAVESEDTFVRPVDAVKVITVRTTAFPAAAAAESAAAEEAAPQVDAKPLTQWVREDVVKSDRPDLASAKRVVAGGRAVKSAEGFQLGAAVGASRAAVDAGYCDNSLQVGQTGRIVAPELYIAIGISGAIQHLAGMKDSKTIVAINKDADAPIFQIADYGLVGDLFTIVPELMEKIEAK